MITQHPFPFDEAIAGIVENHKADKRPVWERYCNPDFDPGTGDWPHTLECFREWYRKNAGILYLIKPLKETVNCSDDDVNEVVISTFSESVQRAFDDMHDLLCWAIHAWEHDPLILEIEGDAEEEAATNAAKGQPAGLNSEESGENESLSNIIPFTPAS